MLCCQLCAGAVVAVEVVRFRVGVDDGPFQAAALLLRFPLCQIENVDGAGPGIRAEHLLNLDLQTLAAVKRGFDPVTLLPIHGNDGIAGNETIVHRGDVPAVAGCQLVDLLVKRCHVVRSFQQSRPQAASVRVMMSTSVWLHWQDLRS